MQVLSILMAIITFFGGLFGSLGHIVLPGARPNRVVENPAEVIAIYQEIAAANSGIELRESRRITEYPAIPGFDNTAIRTAIDLAFLLSNTTHNGMPGNPAAIVPADLQSARAEFFNNGRTVVITLVPHPQTDGFDGQANAGPVGRTIGVMGAQVQGILGALSGFGLPLNVLNNVVRVHYQNPQVTIRADANSGRIISADFSYNLLLELPVPLLPNLRIGADYSISTSLF